MCLENEQIGVPFQSLVNRIPQDQSLLVTERLNPAERFHRLDEMLSFSVGRFVNSLLMFQHIWVNLIAVEKEGIVPAADVAHLQQMAADLRKGCEVLEIDAGLDRIDVHLNIALSHEPSYSLVSMELKVLCETIEGQLHKRRFAFIPPDKAKLLERVIYDWQPVLAKFSRAGIDIVAATECYALDCNTAAVFHCMRVAEHGLRALAWRLNLRQIGKQKYPLEYAEWGAILNAMRGKLNALQQSTGRNSRKAALTKFYADAASHADYLNEIWRKEVSHARGPYNAPEALNALTRTRQFMELLAQRLKERPSRK